MTINDGNFTFKKEGILTTSDADSKPNTTINGGDFTFYDEALTIWRYSPNYQPSTLTINGGNFNSNTEGYFIDTSASIVITSGSIITAENSKGFNIRTNSNLTLTIGTNDDAVYSDGPIVMIPSGKITDSTVSPGTTGEQILNFYDGVITSNTDDIIASYPGTNARTLKIVTPENYMVCYRKVNNAYSARLSNKGCQSVDNTEDTSSTDISEKCTLSSSIYKIDNEKLEINGVDYNHSNSTIIKNITATCGTLSISDDNLILNDKESLITYKINKENQILEII